MAEGTNTVDGSVFPTAVGTFMSVSIVAQSLVVSVMNLTPAILGLSASVTVAVAPTATVTDYLTVITCPGNQEVNFKLHPYLFTYRLTLIESERVQFSSD